MEHDKKLIESAEKFVKEKKCQWDHEDWLSFVGSARKKGFNASESELGAILENEKENYLRRKSFEEKKEKIKEIWKQFKDLFAKIIEKIKGAIKKMREDMHRKKIKSEKNDEKEIIPELKIEKEEKSISSEQTVIPEDNEKTFLKTGILGFDSLLDKGIPRGMALLLMGGPGCGKTTFGLHLLAESAKNGEKCLYMSFEEKESRLMSHMKNFGFDAEELVKSGNLVLKRYDPFSISQSVEALLAEARGELLIKIDKIKHFIPKNFMPTIIVLDSLSAVAAAFAGKKEGYRIYIEQLFRSLEEIGATSFLITETSINAKGYESKVEEFLADGVISFYNIRKGNSRIKAIEIIKIRGVNFKKKIVPFEIIEGQGMEVYPMEEVFTKKM